MADEFFRLDATAQADLVRRAEVSPRELVEAAVARIEQHNPTLNAVIHPAFERALERATGKLPEGPFRGVPFLMKDLGGQEAGQPHHAGMACLKRAGWTEREDSYLARKFVSAGLVCLGRTNTPELGLLPTSEPEAYGATPNPWNLRHSAGGSSGGAAAAVAAGLVPAAHASDGGGSIRGPASKCGLVGLKPTRGRNSFGPALGERWSGFSCEFVVTRSVRDSAALLDATCGAMPGDPYAAAPPARPFADEVGADPGRLRVGLMRRAPRGLEVHAEAVAAVDSAARMIESLGHDVEEAHPEALDDPDSVASYVNVVCANVARAVSAWGAAIGRPIDDDIEPLTRALAIRGREIRAEELLGNIEFVHRFGRRVAAWYEPGFDLLLTPTQAAPPAPLGMLTSTSEEPLRAFVRSAPYGVFTLPFNLSGQPAISLPLHWGADGLPQGVQLVAPAGCEDRLLRIAAQLETAAPWAERWPELAASA